VDWLNAMFHTILLTIDSVIYWAVSQCYKLFIQLSTAQIFGESFYANFANRIYAILGVFMLFYLAYALLNVIVDPEKLAKGDKSVSKLATNFVVSLVIIGLLPSIFSYAYRLQNYVLSSNLIGALVFGTPVVDVSGGESDESMLGFGDSVSFTVMNAFINPDNYNVNMGGNVNWWDFKRQVLEDGDYGNLSGLAKPMVYGSANIGGTSGANVYPKYRMVLSTAAGIYLCYILLSFAIDLGVRIIKLAFCQLIAPIPVLMRAMPSKKGQFDKWLKMTLSVYFEVFVRVGIMYISVYFINEIISNGTFDDFLSNGPIGLIALVIVILGIFTFAKQAPKMLSDILGIDSGNLKLGLGEKLKASGFFAGGAMVGAGATGLVRNTIHGVGNTWSNLKKGDILGAGKSLIGTPLSGIAGTSSAMFNAYKSGKGAKGFGDMKKAAEAGVKVSTQNRERRAAYTASHGGIIDVYEGHVSDALKGVGQWAGVDTGLEALKGLQAGAKEVKDSRKAIDDRLTAILNRDKNLMKSLRTYTVAGVGSFDNYADVLNEMEIMKSTGKTSSGANITSHMLTEMAKTEYKMKEDMKKDILAGYDLKSGTGSKYTDFSKYDNDLKELITAYRTKALKNASIISENSKVDATNYLNQAIGNQNQDLKDFIMSDNANKLFTESNDAIKSANTEISQKVAQRIEKEAANKK